MKIIMHYPDTEQMCSELKIQIAKIHSEAVTSYLQNLNCSKEEKKKIIHELKLGNKAK